MTEFPPSPLPFGVAQIDQVPILCIQRSGDSIVSDVHKAIMHNIHIYYHYIITYYACLRSLAPKVRGSRARRLSNSKIVIICNDNENNNNNDMCVYYMVLYYMKLLLWTYTGVDKALRCCPQPWAYRANKFTHTHIANISWSVYTCIICVCNVCVQSLIIQRAAAAAIK